MGVQKSDIEGREQTQKLTKTHRGDKETFGTETGPIKKDGWGSKKIRKRVIKSKNKSSEGIWEDSRYLN